MFTGIVEEVGRVLAVEPQDSNRDLVITARMTPELRVDQSVSHNGVCLTVVEVSTAPDQPTAWYRVTAVQETLQRSNLGALKAASEMAEALGETETSGRYRAIYEKGRAWADARWATSVKVVLGDDEARAEEAWRLLVAHGARHVYVLAGGVNLWLDVFRDGRTDAAPARGAAATDTLRHAFPSSLGARLPWARPDIATYRRLLATKARAFTPRVQPVTKAVAAAGGCG